MSSHYVTDDSVDLRALRHDLRGLIMPLGIALGAMKSGQEAEGLELQEEVLKKLRSIVAQLDGAPESLKDRRNV
jgi:hypothetical protein